MSPLLRRLVTSVSASALALVPVMARANPLNGQVVGGSATIAGQGTSQVIVDQSSQRAIIDWRSFDIAPGETTRFVQPNASSVILNRVTGGMGASQIEGMIKANGGVYVVNPDGLLFGPSAQVNVGSFLGTTHDIANGDFMAEKYNFTISGSPSASIVNQGTITAANGGFAALVAPGVRNDGIITAKLGTVALAAGNAFTLDLYGDNLIKLQPSDAVAAQVIDVATGQTLKTLVENKGRLEADGGTVALTAVAAEKVLDSVINSSGVIEANSVGTKNGLVVFGAATATTKPTGAPAQTVKIAGTIAAAGRKAGTKGGEIQISGEDIRLAGARLDASGQAGGGTVLVGGAGHSGVGAAIPVASNVAADAATRIDVSARETGNGGRAVVWSDGATAFAGTILAGAAVGNGGFVETSGHTLAIDGASVSTAAPNGQAGQWLLDPNNFTIDAAAAGTIVGNLAGSNVTITTSAAGTGGSGDIIVAAPVAWSSANSLTLSAYRNIAVDANITNSGGAAVNLRADNSGTGVGTVSFAGGAKVSTAGAVSIFYNPSVNPVGSTVNATSYVSPTENFSGDVTGGGQLTAYMLVNSVYDLQNIENNLAGTYALGTNIDASATAGWNGGAGFVPIGNSTTNFTGAFNGQGNTISNLTINLPSTFYVGLFGYIGAGGMIENTGLVGAAVIGGYGYVGSLAGENDGTIANSHANGTVSGTNAIMIGGLAGNNQGTITQSYAATVVSGGAGEIGGLVGENDGTVSQSYATGAVNAANSGDVGGLVGGNWGIVSKSYATGSVSTSGSNSYYQAVGGLVGYNASTITQSYATGAVNGGSKDYVGGLVGENTGTMALYGPSSVIIGYTRGTISQSYATGQVRGGDTVFVGGLVGDNGGTIAQTYSTGRIRGGVSSDLGGLVGWNDVGSAVSGSYWDIAVSGIGVHNGVGNAADAAGVTGLSTVQMQDLSSFQTTYAGWDFQNVWSPPNQAGQGGQSIAYYPQLYALTPVVWALADDATRTYGAANTTIAMPTFGGPGAYAFGPAGDRLNVLSAFSTPATPGSNVGTYSLTSTSPTATSAGVVVYRVVSTGPETLTITPAAVTVTALGGTSVYGASPSNPGLSATGLQNGQSVNVLTGLSNSFGITSASGVGSSPYALSVAGTLSNPNYIVTGTANGSWTVTPADITVTALGGTSVYGSSPSNPGLSATGLQNGQSVSVLTGLSNSFGITSTSGVGSSPYTLTVAGTLTNPNYYVTGTNNGTWVVNPATLTYVANAASSFYGSALPALGGSVTGFVNDQTLATATAGTLGFSTSATASSNVGSYAINGSGLTANNGNYVFVQAPGNATALTINPADPPPTITPEVIAYGANPSPAVTTPQTTGAGSASCNSTSTPNFGLNGAGGVERTQVASDETWQNFLRAVERVAALQKPIAAADLEAARRQMQSTPSASADAMALANRIGSALIAHNQVDDSTGTKKIRIAVGDDVFAEEVVQTGQDSNGKLLFTDDTNLAIGPTSTVKLDRFVFAGDKNYSTAIIDLTKGTFRFITGNSEKKAYQIRTPVATVGVRGTIVDIKIVAGNTTVALQEGNAIVCRRGKTDCVDLAPGQTAVVTTRKAARAPSGWSFASICTGALCDKSTVASSAPASGTQQVAFGASGPAIQCNDNN